MRLLTAILILMGLAVASGEGEDDVQLILGDEQVVTLDCADDLQLAIEDVFDDVEVVQTVDLDASDEDFEIDPAFNVIVYMDEDIINGNCTAIIEDVLDIIDVPQVQVVTRGDHSYYYKSRSKSRSKRRCPYWKKRGFHGYHKKWWSSSRDDSDSEDRKKRWWMKKKKQGWRKRQFLRWWDSADSDDGHWKNWKRSRGSWKRSKGTDTSKKGPVKKDFESSSSSEDPPKPKKKQESVESERSRPKEDSSKKVKVIKGASPSQDSVESERSRQPPKVKVVRKKPSSPPKRKPSSPPKPKPEPKRKPPSPPKPKPEPKKKKNLRPPKKRGKSEEEEESD